MAKTKLWKSSVHGDELTPPSRNLLAELLISMVQTAKKLCANEKKNSRRPLLVSYREYERRCEKIVALMHYCYASVHLTQWCICVTILSHLVKEW